MKIESLRRIEIATEPLPPFMSNNNFQIAERKFKAELSILSQRLTLSVGALPASLTMLSFVTNGHYPSIQCGLSGI